MRVMPIVFVAVLFGLQNVYYYVKIVIAPTGVLDTVNSKAGYGNLSLLF